MKVTDVLWERYQTRVDEASSADNALRNRTADQLHEDYLHLEHRVERLTLINRAMWEFLCETHDWDEGKLFERVREIDGRDGSVDGRIKAQVVACPECGHHVNLRHPVCVYCGYRDFRLCPRHQTYKSWHSTDPT